MWRVRHGLITRRRATAGNEEAPVDEAINQDPFHHHQGPSVLFYRAALPLSRQTLTYVSGIIRRHRKPTFTELATGSGVGTTTAWRYVRETVALLAARAPKLRKAVRDATKAGHAYIVLEGTLIPIDRVAADRPFYSGKPKKHGMNLQVIASPGGDIVWVSGTLPGSVHDKKAEWVRHEVARDERIRRLEGWSMRIGGVAPG